eukprot:scaffold1452_cov117-Isochrysis_galbana.AAC.12
MGRKPGILCCSKNKTAMFQKGHPPLGAPSGVATAFQAPSLRTASKEATIAMTMASREGMKKVSAAIQLREEL